MNEAPFTLLREMSVTIHDFLRLVPAAARAAMGDVPVATTKNGATIGDGVKQVEITLVEIPEKRIGSLQLPRIEAHFAFHGYSEVERTTFLERFDRVTQRGGG